MGGKEGTGRGSDGDYWDTARDGAQERKSRRLTRRGGLRQLTPLGAVPVRPERETGTASAAVAVAAATAAMCRVESSRSQATTATAAASSRVQPPPPTS